MTPVPEIVVTDVVPEGELWLVPRVNVTVPMPIDGLDLLSTMQLTAQLWGDEILAAAKRGEVVVIRGIKP